MSGDTLCFDLSGKKEAQTRSSNPSRSSCSSSTMQIGVTSLELLPKRFVFSDNALWPQHRLPQSRHYSFRQKVG